MPRLRLIRPAFAATLAIVVALLPLAAQAQADCPPPPAPPDAQALAAAQRDARDRGFLWRLQKDGRISWLYGTVHMGRLDWVFPGPQVRQAFDASQTLALELDLTDPDTQRRVAAGSAARPADALPAPLQQRLNRRAQAECAAVEPLARLKPELQIATLSMLAGRRLGLEPGYGIDMALAGMARRDGKTVAALESVDEQLKALAGGSRAEVTELVASTLDELDGGRAQKMLGHIVQTWASGDHARLARYAEWCECQRTAAEATAMRRLLEGRNPAMAARIDHLHRAGARVFAAVGSLHLIGPRGLPTLLAQRGYRVERIALETPMPDILALWDFDDPAASEARFRAALDDVAAPPTHDAALSLRTQIARTMSLRRRFDEAHRLLDAVDAELPGAGPEPRVRTLLERGRTWRSAREPARARPLFLQAEQLARSAKLEYLHVDALHMAALLETDPHTQLEANQRALAAARAAGDPQARRWEASLTHNIGWSLHEAGRHEEALASFRDALAARQRDSARPERVREAHWMIAFELRALHRHDEALAVLRSLEGELAAAGAADGFVPEEIAENLLALGRAAEAKPYFAQAHAQLSRIETVERPDDARLARLLALSR
ncbi:TraB/GumN family protein [Variovorax sp. YR752]|uniref:TraB/GumN family protein n=1 Tax=Variovorax sp. YR752 TaxID=1884383 RepID=UPI0031383B49